MRRELLVLLLTLLLGADSAAAQDRERLVALLE
jgi:hypothetical protein